jgi:AcrR family transcriptional regulator
VPQSRGSYHHGDLRRTLLAAAVETIEEMGPAAISLREVARRAGVTHPAANYHFGDKAGLLTAVAAEGFRMLGDALQQAWDETGSFLEVGVAYVRFALTHRPHFDLMYRPELYHRDDEELMKAKAVAATMLYGTDMPGTDEMEEGVAAWAIMHGVATLWLNGALPDQLGADPERIARSVASHLSLRHISS